MVRRNAARDALLTVRWSGTIECVAPRWWGLGDGNRVRSCREDAGGDGESRVERGDWKLNAGGMRAGEK